MNEINFEVKKKHDVLLTYAKLFDAVNNLKDDEVVVVHDMTRKTASPIRRMITYRKIRATTKLIGTDLIIEKKR